MLDKRAIVNEGLYQKLEKELANIVSKLDFEKINEEHKDLIEDLGNCVYSVATVTEAMEE